MSKADILVRMYKLGISMEQIEVLCYQDLYDAHGVIRFDIFYTTLLFLKVLGAVGTYEHTTSKRALK